MKLSIFRVLSAVWLLAVFLAAGGSSAQQQPSPAPASKAQATSLPLAKPEVSINAVMVGLVDHAAHNLWDVEREGRAPKSESEWEIVAEHAIQVAAAGPAITVGGTGPTDSAWVASASWRAHAQRIPTPASPRSMRPRRETSTRW
jgi:hypothetical protein